MSIPQNAMPPGVRMSTALPQMHFIPHQSGAQMPTIRFGQVSGQPMGRGPIPGNMIGIRPPMKIKKKRLRDKMIHPQVLKLVPESQAYMDLLGFERKLDSTITRKRLDIQEALKRPSKVKRRLRIYVSHTFSPGKESEKEGVEGTAAQWELRVEGRLMDEPQPNPAQKNPKRQFSSFLKSLIIKLDERIYGPDSHLVEWHRTPRTNETDGFQVKRPGNSNVACKIMLLLDYHPMKFKLTGELADLLGMQMETRPKIIEALWQYVKTHHLQDPTERDHINCDFILQRIFHCQRMRLMEIPQRLQSLLQQPDPIIINYLITVEGSDPKRTACYDIDVEIDDPLKEQLQQFVQTTAKYQDGDKLDDTIEEVVGCVNEMKLRRDSYLSFVEDPQGYIQKWLGSQSKDFKSLTEVVGQPEEERRAEFYTQPWVGEAVCRLFCNKPCAYVYLELWLLKEMFLLSLLLECCLYYEMI